MTQLAGQRAVNVKYYLTSGEGGAGIDASRIQVKAGTVKSKSAKIYIVPGCHLHRRINPGRRDAGEGSASKCSCEEEQERLLGELMKSGNGQSFLPVRLH